MLMRFDCRRHLPAALFFVVLLLSGLTVNLWAQANAVAPPETSVKSPAYDVVSIKPSRSDEQYVKWQDLPNGIDYTDMPLGPLIYIAYGITSDSQISGLPEWVRSDRYDLSARTDDATAEAWKKLSKEESSKQQKTHSPGSLQRTLQAQDAARGEGNRRL